MRVFVLQLLPKTFVEIHIHVYIHIYNMQMSNTETDYKRRGRRRNGKRRRKMTKRRERRETKKKKKEKGGGRASQTFAFCYKGGFDPEPLPQNHPASLSPHCSHSPAFRDLKRPVLPCSLNLLLQDSEMQKGLFFVPWAALIPCDTSNHLMTKWKKECILLLPLPFQEPQWYPLEQKQKPKKKKMKMRTSAQLNCQLKIKTFVQKPKDFRKFFLL